MGQHTKRRQVLFLIVNTQTGPPYISCPVYFSLNKQLRHFVPIFKTALMTFPLRVSSKA